MEIFEIEGPDGTVYEVEAESIEQAASAFNPETFAQAKQGAGALSALERLESEGDMRPAEAQALADLRAGQDQGQEIIGETGATYRGALQGGTFNFADEIGGLVRGEEKRDEMRAADEQAQRLYPDQFGSGKLAGSIGSGLLSGAAFGPFLKGATTMPSLMARSGVVGGIEGAVYGAGEGEGLQDRLARGVRGGAIGAGVGAAAPPAVMGAVRGARGATDAVMGAAEAITGKGNPKRASRAIADALARSGRSADDVTGAITAAARQGQPEFRTMDAMGVAGQRLASGITRQGGDGAEDLARFLDQRQIDQGDRVRQFVGDAFDSTGTSAKRTAKELNEARKATNTINYNAARANAGPVNLTPTIESIDELLKRNPIIGESSLTGSEIGKRLSGIRSRISNDSEQLIDFDSVLNIKEDLGRVIGQIKKRGDEVPMQIAVVYGKLDDALEDSSDAYRVANKAAREGREVVSAVDEGGAMATGDRAIDNLDVFENMTPEQQSAARIGYGSKVSGDIEKNKAITANKAREFASTKRQDEAAAIARDPDLFRSRLDRENTMFDVQDRALRGSRTADNLQDISNVGPMQNIIRALRAGGNLHFGEAAQNAIAAVAPALTGQNKATRKLIAEALMSADAQKVIEPAQLSQAREAIIRRLLEGGTRGVGREVTP